MSDALTSIERIVVDSACAGRMGVSTSLQLERAWPRSADHMLLEYRDESGRLVPGQWRRHADALEMALDDIRQAVGGQSASTLVAAQRHTILLHAAGEDRKLIALRECLRNPGAALLSHRPERRAVVRLRDDAGVRYAKFNSATTAQALLRTAEHVAQQPQAALRVPRLAAEQVERGVTIWCELAGVNVHELAPEALIAGAPAIGAALSALHALPTAAHLATHDGAAEARVLQRWVEHLHAFAPESAESLGRAAEQCAAELAQLPQVQCAIHRDFFDKQIVVGGDGLIGILDFDTLAVGDPWLDVANHVAHIALRGVQRSWSRDATARAIRAAIAGYVSAAGVGESSNFAPYLRAAVLRLCCVYAFRPRWRDAVTYPKLESVARETTRT